MRDRKEYMRQWRETHREHIREYNAKLREYYAEANRRYRAEHPGKHYQRVKRHEDLNPLVRKAYSKVKYAIKIGRLKILPCEVCNDPKTHAHHEDYFKPLEVTWLCPIHHKAEHIK